MRGGLVDGCAGTKAEDDKRKFRFFFISFFKKLHFLYERHGVSKFDGLPRSMYKARLNDDDSEHDEDLLFSFFYEKIYEILK